MPLHRSNLEGAIAGAALIGAVALAGVPGAATAQAYGGGYPPPPGYADGCQRTGSTIVGALIGAGVGALIGGNVAASGHRGDGAAVGAGVGAVGGGLAGDYAANCQGQPLPPPPPGYSQNDNSWDDGPPPPPPPGYDGGPG